jgi:hypothetical protein
MTRAAVWVLAGATACTARGSEALILSRDREERL